MKTRLLLIFCAGIAVAGITWLARGVYDRFFVHEGRFHVVNHSDQARAVELRFPSGRSAGLNLGPGGMGVVLERDTGEGAIAVTVDGTAVGDVGYVTSYNGESVLTVGGGFATLASISRGTSADVLGVQIKR